LKYHREFFWNSETDIKTRRKRKKKKGLIIYHACTLVWRGVGGEEMEGEREGEVEEDSYSFSSCMVSTTPRCFQALIAFLASLLP
jgi:hypothetical protein